MAEGYCVKCKVRAEIFDSRLVTMKNGRMAVRGTCPECSALMFRILGKASDFDRMAQNPDALEVAFESAHPDEVLIESCAIINREAAKYLAKNHWELYSIPNDFFEKLMAEIFASFGFEVELNVRLGGAGHGHEADIVMFRRMQGVKKPIGYVVECKRFAAHRKVDMRIATQTYGVKLLYAREWGLDRAVLATTSSVTKEVHREYASLWDFETKEHQEIVELLKAYSANSAGIHLRDQGLCRDASSLTLSALKISKAID